MLNYLQQLTLWIFFGACFSIAYSAPPTTQNNFDFKLPPTANKGDGSNQNTTARSTREQLSTQHHAFAGKTVPSLEAIISLQPPPAPKRSPLETPAIQYSQQQKKVLVSSNQLAASGKRLNEASKKAVGIGSEESNRGQNSPPVPPKAPTNVSIQ